MPRRRNTFYALSTTASTEVQTVQEPSPSYSSAGSTALPATATSVTSIPDTNDPVVAWQKSDEAARYKGRWVALDEASGRVLAVADSPTDFDESSIGDATLVFVRPSGT